MKEFNLPNIDNEKSVLKTIRIKLITLKKIEELSKGSNISVNRLINECIELHLIICQEILLIDTNIKIGFFFSCIIFPSSSSFLIFNLTLLI